MASAGFSIVVFLFLCLAPLGLLALADDDIQVVGISLENPTVLLVPTGQPKLLPGGKAGAFSACKRAKVSGLSRTNIRRYANAFHIALKPSEGIPEKNYGKIGVCLHRNASVAHCQCPENEWKSIQDGYWSTFTSPYREMYIDVKFMDGLTGFITISLEEVVQQWRLLFLGLGLVILLLAPVASQWVPFYYSTSMFLGVLLVILILLFQGMKLLPTGRKSAFYLAIYGSLVGIGSYIAHYFSMVVNSILESFGLSQEMHNPVSLFVFVGILLAGAGLGYWGVRKFVLSSDGSVDIGVAQFVKWAMRIIGVLFIFESSYDTPLALAAVVSSLALCLIISSKAKKGSQARLANRSLWRPGVKHTSPYQNRAEFLSRPSKLGSGAGKSVTRFISHQESMKSPYALSDSPVKGLISSSSSKSTSLVDSSYYSTFHKTPARKRFSKKEWEDFTRESTREAMREWASSPEFSEWIIENANRIQIMPEDSPEESVGSGSDSSGETAVSNSRVGLFRWR
ncbi:uncharacterized protein LOC116250853 [Nymphaea colorata]|nr:uncharacterized protein LOC116250853 [Nymphaea colorata]